MRQYTSLLYLLFALVSGILIDICFLFEMPGISVLVFMLISLGLYELVRFIYNEKLILTKYHWLAFPLLFFASVFAWRADYLVLTLAGACLLVLTFLYLILTSHPRFFQQFSLLELVELKVKVLIAPFMIIINVFRRLFGRQDRDSYKKLIKPLLKIVLGGVIAFPIFAIVLLLLYSADEIFAQLVRDIIPDLSLAKVGTLILAMILSACLWFYLAGFIEARILDRSR